MHRPSLIFDFGNVVAYFDYLRACDALARRRGMSGADLLSRMRAAGLPELLHELERGRLSSRDFGRSVCSAIDLDAGPDEFDAAWSDVFWLNDSIVPLIRGLDEAGYRLVLGSNTNEVHARRFFSQFEGVLSHFDHHVLSYEIGHLKPSPEFYYACVEASGSPPGSCLFIDDLLENVEGARNIGLVGILYRDTPSLSVALAERGVEVPSVHLP